MPNEDESGIANDAAFPLPYGRGDELHHGGPGIDPRSLPKAQKPRDIYDPYVVSTRSG
jgi:hypothetical protein